MPPRFPRAALASFARARPSRPAAIARSPLLQQVRTHTTRDRYFLRPLQSEAPSPTYDYKFLTQPASVEVSPLPPLPPELIPGARLPLLRRPA